jgi:hypothetical protein
VIGRIWLPGSIACLQGIGFAAIGAFFAPYFLHRQRSYVGFGLIAFYATFQGIAYGQTGALPGLLADRAGHDSIFLPGVS